MPSLTKTLVVLAVAANGFLAPAPQRPATVLQAATIAAKDVSALRKASGSSRCKNAIKRRLQHWSRGPRRRASRKDGSAAATPSPRPRATATKRKTQAPA